MIVYPAIDLKDGICVRLMHGRFDAVTRYDDQPAARLAAFAAAGASWAHIVDLDGAEAGRAVQHALIGKLARAIDIRIQSGGGVRSADDVAALIDAGVARVVVGSLAVSQPDTVADWLRRFGPDRITLAIDVKADGDRWVPALKGWTEAAGVDLWTALDRYPPNLARHLLVTDVGRDGALTGPNLDLLGEIIRRRPDLKVQASGGVATVADLTAAAALGCDGAIVGRALYENRFTLEEALAAFESHRAVVWVQCLRHPSSDEIEWHPALSGRDAADVVEHGGRDDLHQPSGLRGHAVEGHGAPHQPVAKHAAGLVALGEGHGARMFRPQVTSEVVPLGDQLVPAVTVEAPPRVEHLREPLRDDPGRTVLGHAGVLNERFGETLGGEGALGPVDPLGQRDEVV